MFANYLELSWRGLNRLRTMSSSSINNCALAIDVSQNRLCETDPVSVVSVRSRDESKIHFRPEIPKKDTTMSIIPSFFGGRRTNVFDPFALDVWDTFGDFPFARALSRPESSFCNELRQIMNTRIDWKETPEAHVFKADVPGLKKEEVKVEVEEGQILQIRGERSKEHEERNDKWHHVERSSGKFLRRFRLPENAKVNEVKASMENGVLTVTVPKEEVKKPEVKAVQIAG